MNEDRKGVSPLLDYLDSGNHEVFSLVCKKVSLIDIARKLGLPEDTVRKAMHEARYAFGANDDLIDEYFHLLEEWAEETGTSLEEIIGHSGITSPTISPADKQVEKQPILDEMSENWAPWQMRDLAGSILRLADAIDQGWTPDAIKLQYSWPSSAARIEKKSIELGRRAKRLIGQANAREKFLPKEFLVDPSWRMLLELFLQFSGKAKVSTTSLAYASGHPLTTAIRYIRAMEQKGLIRTSELKNDKRVTLVELTKHGVVCVGRLLEDAVV